ncbi:flagellar basal body-associated FliL family protein [Marinospirillum insulare]|uniref:Flagellar protein FliL n=1 Tax=Marinospirillum insulare TaxID=217169 RepID=A0ABQ5ZZ22_9GAMM|nr:flagellar basal body-associated FliL family protein [Marinospirillum insulare]GLR63916.1 flagellar basal body-associated protein FliL [Marinospirillum insulare]
MAEGEKKNKLLLIGGLVIGLAIIGALAVGGTLYFLDREPSEDGEQSTSATQDKPTKSTSFYYSFEEPFVAPMVSSDRRQRFMQTSLAIKTESADIALAVEKHMPLLKNNLNRLFTKQDYQTMQTPEGKLQLQMSAYEVVQEVMDRENMKIDEVLITDFVMQ